MDNLDEILDAMPEPEEDDALDFVIDENMRVIAVPDDGVVLGVEGDKDVNRIRFRMNRHYRGIDLANFDIRVKYQNAGEEKNYFAVEEKAVTDSTITFVWVVAADATAYNGIVWFAVSFFAAEEDGTIAQCFNTTLGKAQSLQGLDVDIKADDRELVDFMTHLKQDLTLHAGEYVTQARNAQSSAANSAVKALASEKNAAQSEKNAMASEDSTRKMLDQLVADYTGGCLGIYSVILPADGWTKADGDTSYSCTATLEASKTSYVPVTAVIPKDIPAGRKAVLYGTCESMDGKIRFWADNQPGQDLHLQIALIVPDMELKG